MLKVSYDLVGLMEISPQELQKNVCRNFLWPGTVRQSVTSSTTVVVLMNFTMIWLEKNLDKWKKYYLRFFFIIILTWFGEFFSNCMQISKRSKIRQNYHCCLLFNTSLISGDMFRIRRFFVGAQQRRFRRRSSLSLLKEGVKWNNWLIFVSD